MRKGFTGLVVGVALLFGACGDSATQRSVTTLASPGGWRTWVLPAAASLKVPPPPPPGSAADRADDAAVARAAEIGGPERRRAEQLVRVVAVAPWLRHAMVLVSRRAKDPPSSSRNYALVAVAMHDAAVAAKHHQEAYDRPPPQVNGASDGSSGPSYPSERAAIATAGAEVLAALYPEAPAAEYRAEAGRIGDAGVVAGVHRPSDVRAGANLGRAVAERVIRRARADGADRVWKGRPPGGAPRYYTAPPGTAGRPVQPLAGKWRTWVLASGRALRPPPPPAFGTPGFEAEVRAVVRAKAQLTPQQERAARFWAGGEGTPLPAGVWLQVALEKLAADPVSTPVAARTMALLAVAMADAGVAAWDAKYAYWYPRPENGIRDSGLSPGFKPLLPTPFFPAYVSGHATYSAAAAEVLSYIYPREARFWRARAQEAADSRVWGGIHWPIDSSVGLAMGRRVGALVVAAARRDEVGS